MEKIDLLGVSFERKTIAEYKEELVRTLESHEQALVVTPNPEMLVAGQRHPQLRQVLNQAHLRVVDGFGIVLLSRFRLTRWPGVDVLKFLAWETKHKHLKLLIAGGRHAGDATLASEQLTGVGYTPGRIELTSNGWVGDEGLKACIEREKPDILVLGLGHGKQEQWLADHLKLFPFVKLGIGVGGAIEFFAGRQVRAPHLLRYAGLEWLYRLIREPRRILRIFTAVIIFPALVFWKKITHTSHISS